MDIRTKLAIALVSVTILGMSLLGYFAYQASAELLQDISERQLNALAESKARDVRKVIESWRDGVRLVTSRTQLRLDLNEFNETQVPELRANISRIVTDAQNSTPSVAALALYGLSGERLAVSGNESLVSTQQDDIEDSISYLGMAEIQTQNFVRFVAPLRLENRAIGSVEIVFTTTELANVTQDYTGLGDSGETIIVHHNEDDEARVLNSLRHGDDRNLINQSESEIINAAISGDERTFTVGLRSYRGNRVWAATRFIADVNWGLIVQVDESEERIPIDSYRGALLDVGLALAAFAILGGSLLGIYLARPLHQLAETVVRVGKGETRLRANNDSEDEIGLVARAFNDFLDKEQSESEKDR